MVTGVIAKWGRSFEPCDTPWLWGVELLNTYKLFFFFPAADLGEVSACWSSESEDWSA